MSEHNSRKNKKVNKETILHSEEVFTNMFKFNKEYEEKLSFCENTLAKVETRIEKEVAELRDHQEEFKEAMLEFRARAKDLNELSLFKLESQSSLSNHENKINSLTQEITDLMMKYDKIFLDNFHFPGVIGIGCKFSNFRQYVFTQSKLMEEHYKTMKEYDERIDRLDRQRVENVKTFLKNLQMHEEKTKKYVQLQINEMKKLIEDLPETFLGKCDELKIENSKYAADLIEKANSLNSLTEKLKEIKNEIFTTIEKFKKENELLIANNTKEIEIALKECQEIKGEMSEVREMAIEIDKKENLYNSQMKKLANENQNISQRLQVLLKRSEAIEKQNTLIIQTQLAIKEKFASQIEPGDVEVFNSIEEELISKIKETAKDEVNKFESLRKESERRFDEFERKFEEEKKNFKGMFENARDQIAMQNRAMFDGINKKVKEANDGVNEVKGIIESSLNDIKGASASLSTRVQNVEAKISFHDLFGKEIEHLKIKSESLDKLISHYDNDLTMIFNKVNKFIANYEKESEKSTEKKERKIEVSTDMKNNDEVNTNTNMNIKDQNKGSFISSYKAKVKLLKEKKAPELSSSINTHDNNKQIGAYTAKHITKEGGKIRKTTPQSTTRVPFIRSCSAIDISSTERTKREELNMRGSPKSSGFKQIKKDKLFENRVKSSLQRKYKLDKSNSKIEKSKFELNIEKSVKERKGKYGDKTFCFSQKMQKFYSLKDLVSHMFVSSNEAENGLNDKK